MAIMKMTSTLKFPEGDTRGVRALLMYDGPASQSGMCQFQLGQATQYSSSIISEKMIQPCDGKQWAHFRVAATDVTFIAHLMHTHYKGTPVTLLEISDHRVPDSIRLVY